MGNFQKLIEEEILKHRTCFPKEAENLTITTLYPISCFYVECSCGDMILYKTGADPELAIIKHISYELSYGLSRALPAEIAVALHKFT